jgi:PhnB protein
MQLNSYLMFNGQCEEAFTFYAKCLGGKIEVMMPHAGSPAEAHTPPEWRDKILHACLSIGDSKLMASDAPPNHYEKVQGTFVNIAIEDSLEGERIFNELSEGGTVRMPFAKTFWAERFGMVVDRFGTPWMVNCGPRENQG